MVSEKIERRQLPVGIGGEKLKEGRETLPAVEVDNEVSWVNSKMNLPFELKVGKPTHLGMFLTPSPQEGDSVYNLEVSGSHSRSGILGRVIFSDKGGRLYRDIDLKGSGFIKSFYRRRSEVWPVRKESPREFPGESLYGYFRGTTGITNQELIMRDVKFSEKFLKAGIRTHRVIAVIDLKEIIDDNGKKINIDEARKDSILSKEDEPVIEVRAYGTKSRLFDLQRALRDGEIGGEDSNALKLLSDAKNIVAQELNIDPDTFTASDYFEWLIKTTAINVARMHYNKWVNGYMTEHNITLDGRIVDLDSVETEAEARRRNHLGVLGDPKNFLNDRLQATQALGELLYQVKRVKIYEFDGGKKNFFTFFDELYYNELKRLKTEKIPRVRN